MKYNKTKKESPEMKCHPQNGIRNSRITRISDDQRLCISSERKGEKEIHFDILNSNVLLSDSAVSLPPPEVDENKN